MTRSDRYLEAVRAFETYRLEQKAKPPDLFSVVKSVADNEGRVWRAQALAALEDAALANRELTVEDIAWPKALDNRARGAVLLEGVRRGWIKSIGYVSGGAGRHGRPIKLWSSKVYDPTGGFDDAA